MKLIKLIFHAFRDLIIRYLPKIRGKGGFAFIVHPRNIPDVYRKYPFLKILPIPALELFLKYYWPVVLSEVEGMKDNNGKSVKGWVITISLTAEQMLKDKNLAKKKIIQAVKLAEKMGAEITGLGAFTASITDGGKEIVNQTKTFITSGNSLTAGITVSEIDKILKDKNFKNLKLAIIGATTPIGSAISKILSSKYNLDSLILVGKTLSHIDELKNEINILNKSLQIISTTNLDDIKMADVVITTTSAKGSNILSKHLKQNTIVYDIAQPKNTSEEIINQRKDVKFIEGGLISTPGINYHFNFGIPKETAFGCLAETMILAAENKKDNYSLNEIEPKKVEEILKLARKYNFT